MNEATLTWLAMRAVRWLACLGFLAQSLAFVFDRPGQFTPFGHLQPTTEAVMFGAGLLAIFAGFIELGLRERAGFQRPRPGQLIPPKATAATPEFNR
jgi:hypothetical protein